MKSTLMKATFGLLAMSTVGFAATGAQADWGRGSPVYGYGGHAYQQSQMFSQLVDARQDRQVERIRAGLRSGTLTRFEFNALMWEQHNIRAMEQHFRADGLIDAREFKRLDRALDIAGNNIKLEKHDREGRYAYNHQRWHD